MLRVKGERLQTCVLPSDALSHQATGASPALCCAWVAQGQQNFSRAALIPEPVQKTRMQIAQLADVSRQFPLILRGNCLQCGASAFADGRQARRKPPAVAG